jgi:hypothetical protein
MMHGQQNPNAFDCRLIVYVSAMCSRIVAQCDRFAEVLAMKLLAQPIDACHLGLVAGWCSHGSWGCCLLGQGRCNCCQLHHAQIACLHHHASAFVSFREHEVLLVADRVGLPKLKP